MWSFLDFIAKPLGQFLNILYNSIAFKNYGLAIIFFTIIIRIVILPLTIKQYRSSARMQELSPQIQELQKRYKNDKVKLNEEMMKFYQENKVNPAGGCLPLLIQMPILISLWQVIGRPLTYMQGMKAKDVTTLLGFLKIPKKGYYEIAAIIKSLNPNIPAAAQDFLHNFAKLPKLEFLGMNLGLVPTYDFHKLTSQPEYIGLLILPLLATVTTFLSSKLMMASSLSQSNSNAQMAGMQKTMLYIAPLMTLFISFQVPAGLALYWTTGYIIQIIQQIYINKTVFKKKEVVKK